MEGVAQTAAVNGVNDGVAIAALMANKPLAYEGADLPWKSVVGGGICDLREAVAQTRADIRESIQNLSIQNTQQFAHVHEKACDAEKEAIKAQYEGKLQTIQTGKEVENRVSDFERNADSRFTELEKSILRESCAIKEVVHDQGERTREKIAECCCETKERLAALELKGAEQFGKLSEQHLRQTLSDTKDELNEARFEAVLAKLEKGVK